MTLNSSDMISTTTTEQAEEALNGLCDNELMNPLPEQIALVSVLVATNYFCTCFMQDYALEFLWWPH